MWNTQITTLVSSKSKMEVPMMNKFALSVVTAGLITRVCLILRCWKGPSTLRMWREQMLGISMCQKMLGRLTPENNWFKEQWNALKQPYPNRYVMATYYTSVIFAMYFYWLHMLQIVFKFIFVVCLVFCGKISREIIHLIQNSIKLEW